jgi:hypothetical protein
MREQKVIRTYPKGYASPTKALNDALSQGFYVVMSNSFEINGGKEHGIEYIVEREESKGCLGFH